MGAVPINVPYQYSKRKRFKGSVKNRYIMHNKSSLPRKNLLLLAKTI